ncbi:MAG TPA: VWA domain-containing protein [Candidatus Polarisedimenticolaceae bacterium]|nr:VWA domain-containing protein [Candidatus Polarisedimenticolaceae bacterium]
MRSFLAFLLIASPLLAAEPGVQFAAPRRQATAVGPSKAQVEVVPPAGATVVRVALFVDGKPTGTLTSPPWTFEWDAGDGSVAHKLDALATFTDGTEARASVTTSKLTINATEEVALVNLYAIARNPKGGYVNDLQEQDFRISENGNPQTIKRFSAERRPLRIAVVLDTSLSMEGDKLKSAIDSAVAFLDILQPGDEGLVVTFSDEAAVRRDLTSNRGELEAAIRTVEARGGTSLYDAIFKASQRLAEFDGRRVLLLLSDGRDEAASGLEPGSLHTLEEARDRALRDEVMVFAIGLGKGVARDAKALEENPTARATELDFYGRQPLVTILRSLAETTGGTAVFAPGAGQLRRSFEQVAEDLRHQYALAYTSDDPRHDGAWREIKVHVVRPGVSVTNRKGYYAPSDIPVRRSNTKLRP